ncbi:MAG: LTA synthase family protein [Lachnospiraceae bacterium]|nr:LTA synthase family protein [Lachnospiraceae bacterium]
MKTANDDRVDNSYENLKKNKIRSALPAVIFYPLAILYFELMLKGMDEYNTFFDISLLTTILFSLAVGFLLALIFSLIRPVVLSRILSGLTLIALWLVFCVEYDCNMFYKMYYGFIYAAAATGNVMNDFSDVVWAVAAEYWLEELIFFVPVIDFLILFPWILHKRKISVKLLPTLLVPFMIFQLAASIIGRFGPDSNIYTTDFTVFNAVPRFGLLSTFRLEFTYMLFSTPEADITDESYTLWVADDQPDNGNTLPDGSESDGLINADNSSSSDVNSSDSSGSNNLSSDAAGHNNDELLGTDTKIGEVSPKPVEYEYNMTVDFAELIENESNGTVKKMHEYFGSLEPTKQNEYTGYFEGKNLIFITAEAFCPYAVDEEFTPTLYKLANNGFVFENYYQPSWSLSTTGGEFANLTGIIPEWIDAGNSFTVSADKYMPYSPAGLFSREGYVCKAYHNNTFDFYDRDKTHPNLGYDYKGVGNGLKLEHRTWPYSDLEMMEATVDEMIDNYKADNVPFHTYYMTVSGHCNYNWGGNAMSSKHKEAAKEAFPEASQSVQAYMACNKELDLAMEYLLKRLEEAGIADDTVIVLGADHYPYAMSEGNEEDYYIELSGIEDTPKSISRYQNTLIMYCSSMKEPVYVDTPCSSIDIVPTIANLFGIEYDSRLYSGRDIFATNYTHGEVSSTIPLVIIPIGNRYSFITDAGSYDAVTKEFTANTEIEDEKQYINDVQNIISSKWKYAKLMITNNYYSKVFPNGLE